MREHLVQDPQHELLPESGREELFERDRRSEPQLAGTRVGWLVRAWRRPSEAYHLTMLPVNSISERLVDLKEEMNELKATNLRYWAKGHHTELEKSAHAHRQEQLLGIKEELSNMMKRSG